MLCTPGQGCSAGAHEALQEPWGWLQTSATEPGRRIGAVGLQLPVRAEELV